VRCDRFNSFSTHVLACPITSHPATELDIGVKPTLHNGLRHDSSMLARMLTPILKDELGEPCGRIGFETVKQVLPRLQMIIEAR
jgi:mRNA-degrading endonuclease toxin of MazEF toxin-antitoxin module